MLYYSYSLGGITLNKGILGECERRGITVDVFVYEVLFAIFVR